MNSFNIMQKHYRQRDLAAREWKAKGGKVVGYFCDKVPEEIIRAAGFLPVRLSGNPWGSTQEADKYAEPFHEGFVHSMFNQLLKGEFDYLDYLIIPHSRDTVVGLYGLILQVKELEPDRQLPEIYFYETLHSRYYLTDVYNRESMRELKAKLEEWSGQTLSKEALLQAIDLGNTNKKLLKQIVDLRIVDFPRISGTEALQIFSSSVLTLKEEHNRLLSEYLEEAKNWPVKEGARLFVAGSPLDNLQFYELVESCDAIIVAEDNCWGSRYAEDPIKTTSDPMEAIADRYQSQTACTWAFPMNLRREYILRKVMESKAQGVIIYINDWDYAGAWDAPLIKQGLEEKGIPLITCGHQPYLYTDTIRDKLKSSISDFVKVLKTNKK
jgi:benzoyl-CoA reductase/2-hydroxyglutaryl-CoA dehydratase subunit BcrC/BadD/HgdB